jgi:RHS repeat-associated protein
MMDDLSYNYGTSVTSSNQLLKVSDTGDKAKGFTEGADVYNDYAYDRNGNMVSDINKSINAIAYNILNLPTYVLKSTGETILYYYDATGRKLSQLVRDPSGIQKKSTGYHGEYIYENDSLKFTNHEEGRVIMKDGEEPEYQYHLKDHLGNVRMTFTTKDEVDSVRATLEVNHAAEDSVNFLNYDKARLIYGSLFDHTNGASPGYAQRLSGAEGEKIGLAKSFSVMPGDVITAEVFAKYFDVPQDPGTLPMILQTLLNNLLNPAASGGAVIDRVGYGASGSLGLPFLEGFGEQDDEDVPKAFLNYIYINRDFDVESIRMGFEPITEAALEDGMGGAHERLLLEYTVKEAGYVYVYLSNDGEEVREVYFDDFKIEHIKSPVIQSEDFYPFGLTFNSYQRENSINNKYLYNQGSGRKKFNTERIFDLDLNVDQSKYRTYDYITGRWWQVDPKADSLINVNFTPYNYSFNNPIRYNDPKGDCPWCWGAVVGFTVEYASQVVGNIIENGGEVSLKAFTNIDVSDLAVATGVGAATGGLSALGTTFTKTAIIGGKVAVNAIGEGVKATTDTKLNTQTGEVQVNSIINEKSGTRAAVEFTTGMIPTPNVTSKAATAPANAAGEAIAGSVKASLDEGINAQVKDTKGSTVTTTSDNNKKQN